MPSAIRWIRHGRKGPSHMHDDLAALGILGALGVSLLTMVVMVWIRPGKGGPGWMMAASSIFLVVGFGGVGILLFGNPFHGKIPWDVDILAALAFLAWSLAALLFSTGFLWDRMRRREASSSLTRSEPPG